MKRPTNSREATTIVAVEADAASWATLDALPPQVRRALWEAPLSISPASVASLLARGGEGYAIRALKEAAAAELRMFAAQHQVRHGYELPHQQAMATVQRY